MKKDLANRKDIVILIEAFYIQLREDELVGKFFTDAILLELNAHLDVVVNFWDTVLFNAKSYDGNVMLKHIELDKKIPLENTHFERWKLLFFNTLDENFYGVNADEIKRRVELIMPLMQFKVEQGRKPGAIL